MSVGSAFDAFVKSYLHEKLIGSDPRYTRDALFEKQVEPHNRDWALVAGQHVFEKYCESGALVDLMAELQRGVGEPRFEFEINGFVQAKLGGSEVPMTGRPDIFFINELGARVIYDWKVNGYCSNSPVSPKAGYVKCRDGWRGSEKKASRLNMAPHPDCYPQEYKGLKINAFKKMQEIEVDWANQLHVYSWLLGEQIGSDDLILGIDQICGQPGETRPWLRVASHRVKADAEYQFMLVALIESIWDTIQGGHIFDTLTREESDAKCQQLEDVASGLSGTDELSKFMNLNCRDN
jgi:hypothetical protein